MSTHSSSWRSILAFGPGLSVALVGLAVVQGTTGLATTRAVYLALAPLAACGWLAAWRMARASARPVVAIAAARSGPVALRGVARP